MNPQPKEKDKKILTVSEFRKLKVKPEKSFQKGSHSVASLKNIH